MRELLREQSNYGTNVVATRTEQVKSMLRIHQHQRWQYEHFIDTCTSTIIKHKSTGGSKTQKLMTGSKPTYASNSWTTWCNSTRGGHRKGSLWYLIKKDLLLVNWTFQLTVDDREKEVANWPSSPPTWRNWAGTKPSAFFWLKALKSGKAGLGHIFTWSSAPRSEKGGNGKPLTGLECPSIRGL